MTCIVGLVHEGVAYIGGDSLGSNGYSKTVRKDKKVFKVKGLESTVIGYTSSYRMGQLLMYKDDLIDSRDVDKVDHEYIVTKTVPKIISLFEENGFGKIDSNVKRGGCFLLAHKDQLYSIEGDYQVGISSDAYAAVGCGEDFALGSLYATENTNLTPEERITMALEAAAKFSVGVEGPFDILSTGKKEAEVVVAHGILQ